MDLVLRKLIMNAQSFDKDKYEKSLSDLRFLIERNTMNRFSEKEESQYFDLFNDKALVHYHMAAEDLELTKRIVIYMLFNFSDRAILSAKCIKVFFDHMMEEAICNGIEIYMKSNDLATCELIYAITNSYDDQSYLKNERVFSTFQQVLKSGGEHSKSIIQEELNLYRGNF